MDPIDDRLVPPSGPDADDETGNEKELFRAMNSAITAGQVSGGQLSLALDLKRLDHIDSSIAVQADSNRWIAGIMIAAIAGYFLRNWQTGAGASAMILSIYLVFGRGWIQRRMKARFHKTVLTDIDAFKKLWKLKGITLSFRHDTDGTKDAVCTSPKGDWRRFVLDHLMDGSGTPD